MGKKRPVPYTIDLEAGDSSSSPKETTGGPMGQALASSSSSTIGKTKRVKCAGLDSNVEGKVKLIVTNISQSQQWDGATTSCRTIANLPWSLHAAAESSARTRNVKYLGVYIRCNQKSESTLWSCEADVEFKLCSQNEDLGHLVKQSSAKFDFYSNSRGFSKFIKWNDVLNVDKGYIKSDRVILEANVTVQKVSGVILNPTFNFTLPDFCSDGTVVIDNVHLYVSKSYLALYSPVFRTLFYGDFQETHKVSLEDVILEEFSQFLQVIYPSHRKVTAENVEFLLELGDKFKVQYVIHKCEQFLTSTNQIQVITKLMWADRYQLARVQDVCIRKFKTMTEIQNLKSLEEYKTLSDKTKCALLEKIFKFM